MQASRSVLTPEEAIRKRDELMIDGYCVAPGAMRGEFLERVRAFTNQFLDENPVDPKHRYQGSDFHIVTEKLWEARGKPPTMRHHPIVDEILELPEAVDTCAMMGLEGFRPHGSIIILSKPPKGPALYWHQDWMGWLHPSSALPWPQQIFLSYYMVDTNRENGCLKAIPGTHLKRHPLHDILPDAHGPEIQAADESHPAFAPHPDEVDLPVAAGDLVIADARVLHAAWPNTTNERRPLVLVWVAVFPFPTIPSWWTGPIPDEIHADPTVSFPGTRKISQYLKA